MVGLKQSHSRASGIPFPRWARRGPQACGALAEGLWPSGALVRGGKSPFPPSGMAGGPLSALVRWCSAQPGF